MASGVEYPKWLHHPGFSPAVISAGAAGGPLTKGAQYAGPGKPAQFPPVVVHGADDEAWYVSKGYTPGTYDHAKVEQQRVAPKPNSYREVEYPRFEDDGSVTPDPNPPIVETFEYPKYVPGPDGDEIAQNAEEEAAILAKTGRVPEPPVETVEMTPDDLAAFAAWLKAGKPMPQEPKRQRRRAKKAQPAEEIADADEQEGFDASEEAAMEEGRGIGPVGRQDAEDCRDVGERSSA